MDLPRSGDVCEKSINLKFSIIYLFRYKNYPAATAKSRQSCPTLYNPRNGSPPGSSIHGILQARVLEWGSIAFSKKLP